jgi:hypothetical protein
MQKLNLEKPTTESKPVVDEKPVTDQNPVEVNLGDKKPIKDINMAKGPGKLFIVLAIVAAVAGVGTGYLGVKAKSKSSGDNAPSQQVADKISDIKAGDVFGVQDKDTFKDDAEGYLKVGGLDGEGSHSLIRPGGISQTVYLTSSITDLTKFADMQIKVYGETFKGQKVGWLMDVGRVEVVDPKAEEPIEE